MPEWLEKSSLVSLNSVSGNLLSKYCLQHFRKKKKKKNMKEKSIQTPTSSMMKFNKPKIIWKLKAFSIALPQPNAHYLQLFGQHQFNVCSPGRTSDKILGWRWSEDKGKFSLVLHTHTHRVINFQNTHLFSE